MKIKSVLIGSVAALAAVSGAHAADAIVAAEPEALEYVRVCDAFGTGYFYIPGTETCLKIGGYVRFQTNFGRDSGGRSDWNSFTRAQLELDARSETELGTLRGFIALRGDADNAVERGVNVYQAFIELGGFRAGKFDSWWDNDLSGETDTLSTNANFNSVRYVYDNGAFDFGVSVDELEGLDYSALQNQNDNNVGVAANLGFTVGGWSGSLLGSYDVDAEEGAIRAMLTGDFGVGALGLAGIWASGPNAYYAESEWTVAAEYAIRATDKLTITPAVQYFGNVTGPTNVLPYDFTNNDAWTAGVTVDYAWTQGLTSKVTVNYYDEDNGDDEVTGFVRLQRSF
jgi:hypothetical protein